jgi:hypothetical protein
MPPQRRSPSPPPAPSSPLRQLVERRTRVLLVYLSQRPPWTLPLLTAVLLLGGLFSPTAVGVPLLLLVLLLVGWLSYLSWPAVVGVGRLLRLGMLALLVLAIAQRVA